MLENALESVFRIPAWFISGNLSFTNFYTENSRRKRLLLLQNLRDSSVPSVFILKICKRPFILIEPCPYSVFRVPRRFTDYGLRITAHVSREVNKLFKRRLAS